MTPRGQYVLALGLGLAIGFLFGECRAAEEMAAIDRDLAVRDARLWHCERAIGAELTAAQDRVASQCATAAAACGTVAESSVTIERATRSLLWLAPGPKVER